MEERLTKDDRAGTPLWDRPRDLGFQEVPRGLGGVVAPLLAGFALATIATLASADKPPPGRDWAIAALAGAAACLLYGMQVAFVALSHNPTPAELLSWYPEATVDRTTLDHVRRLQARDYQAHNSYSRRAALGYELGLIFFALGLLAVMWPKEWTEPRIIAMLAGAAALILEVWWSISRISRLKIRHPVIRPFALEDVGAASRLATAGVLDPDRRAAAGLAFPALGLPHDDSELVTEIRQLKGSATHFSGIVRERLKALADRLPPGDALRLSIERDIADLEQLEKDGAGAA